MCVCVRVCAVAIRGFLVVMVMRGDVGPVPALLYANTATWYRVLGRSPDTLAVVSSPAVRTRSAAASRSCCRQYRIWAWTTFSQKLINLTGPHCTSALQKFVKVTHRTRNFRLDKAPQIHSCRHIVNVFNFDFSLSLTGSSAEGISFTLINEG